MYSLIPNTGKLRFIEVKGRMADADSITVTRNEVLTEQAGGLHRRLPGRRRPRSALCAGTLRPRAGFRGGERELQAGRALGPGGEAGLNRLLCGKIPTPASKSGLGTELGCKPMEGVFIYWDNSNILHEAQRLAVQREADANARYRVCIEFENLLRLAHADREVKRALAVGSVPPEMRQLWNRMEAMGVEVKLFDRGDSSKGEQDVLDRLLQLRMLEDALDFNGDPGIAVVLTGDGAGYYEGTGFHSTLERMRRRDWRVEILSWAHACNQRMRRWADDNGAFVSLDDFYDSITFMEPSRPGHEFAMPRNPAELDLSRRRMAP